ncbi:hypothetical protein [Hymenobacter rubidus]|uniref:hypothetical protein n=1 Tax=Hymenobacter rubidus TaxID=1441626 RepID=UPI00191F5916|nr:hypothetical protein [Hymenobacter rubidus]
MKCLLLLVLLLSSFAGLSQPVSQRKLEEFYDQLNPYQTRKYRPERGYQLLTLRSNFSAEDLTALRLDGRQLVRVDLVYSAFRLDPEFSQRELNLGRFRNLAAQVPGILANKAITWHLVEQTGCTSPAECQGYFHGFVLYIEKRYTAADTRREADALLRTLDTRTARFEKTRAARVVHSKPIGCNYPRSRYRLKDVAKSLKRAYRRPVKQPTTLAFRAEVDRAGVVQRLAIEPDSVAPYWPELAEKLRESFAFMSGFRVGKEAYPFTFTGVVRLPLRAKSLRVTGYFLADSVMRKYGIRMRADDCVARLYRPGEPRDDAPLPNPDANVVSKVMARHPEWRKQVVVADVTGSMAPYTLDLLTWLQLSTLQQEKTFVFFNDGNDAPDQSKVIGHTGGLYDVKTADFERIKSKVLEAMLAGGGGDAPENDGEAIARALELVPDATEIILLADNHTFPRDISLLKKGGPHVNIILCGATTFINPNYLSLAREYGFSLHTVEADITNLSTKLAGQTITLNGAQYLITKQGFQLIKML